MSEPAFELPRHLEAHEPPEARGLARDDVRLLVTHRSDGVVAHHCFRDLPLLLSPGDLVVTAANFVGTNLLLIQTIQTTEACAAAASHCARRKPGRC